MNDFQMEGETFGKSPTLQVKIFRDDQDQIEILNTNHKSK